MSIAARIATNTVVQLAGKLVGLVIGLVLVAILTRRLGITNYGDYVIALTVSQLFAIVADLGVNTYIIKRLSTQPADEAKVLGSAVGLRLLSLSVVALPALAISFLLPYTRVVQLAIVVGLVAVAIQTLSSLYVAVLQARLQMHYAALSEVVGRALTLLLTVLFLIGSQSVIVVLLAQVIGVSATCALTYRWARRYVTPRDLWQPATWKEMLQESLPISVATMFSYLYFKTDMIILSMVAIAGRDNRVEVGIYGVAYKILEVLILVPGILAGTIFPVLSAFLKREDPRLSRLVDRTTRIVVVLGGSIAAGLCLYASEIIGLISGPAYVDAIVPLRILSLAVFLVFIGSVYTYLALALDQQIRLVWLYGIIALLNIVANLILIPRYSYVGAAWVTVLTDAAVLAGSLQVCRTSYPLQIQWRAVVSLLASVGAVALAAWVLKPIQLVLSLVVLVGGIAIVAQTLGVLTLAEIRSFIKQRVAASQTSETPSPR